MYFISVATILKAVGLLHGLDDRNQICSKTYPTDSVPPTHRGRPWVETRDFEVSVKGIRRFNVSDDHLMQVIRYLDSRLL
jgi:hypothetical protein